MLNIHTTPELNTIFNEALYQLERRFIDEAHKLETWFAAEWQKTLAPIYGSVDLRNAGFKLAPIDMNLFPAGFNNLNQNHLSTCGRAAKDIILRSVSQAKKIILIPESHTRNQFYWSNIHTLQTILKAADFDVRLGTLNPDIKTLTKIALDAGEIILHPLQRTERTLHVEDFFPDVILLNNDLANGIPSILNDISQPILPAPQMGWSQRLKSEYFLHYSHVVNDFSAYFSFDPWLIDPLFRQCGKIDFMQQAGMECVISNAKILFTEIKKKYAQYNIQSEPFLIVKANSGTYGMAVMTVRQIDELSNLNRKQRTKMSTTKGGQPVTSVIIQEGIYTFETLGEDQVVAEPVVYLFGEQVVGGFYRVHQDRGIDENLNAPGMRFEPLPFTETCNAPNAKMEPSVCQNRFYIYGIIAKLSMLAAAREVKHRIPLKDQ